MYKKIGGFIKIIVKYINYIGYKIVVRHTNKCIVLNYFYEKCIFVNIVTD